MFKHIWVINPTGPVVLGNYFKPNKGGLHNFHILPINVTGPIAYVWPFNAIPTGAIVFNFGSGGPPPPPGCDLLLETGGSVLLETGGSLLLEDCAALILEGSPFGNLLFEDGSGELILQS